MTRGGSFIMFVTRLQSLVFGVKDFSFFKYVCVASLSRYLNIMNTCLLCDTHYFFNFVARFLKYAILTVIIFGNITLTCNKVNCL